MTSNEARRASAAARDQQIARTILSYRGSPPACPPLWVPVLRERARDAAASWADIGARLGTGKYAAASLFRRAAVSYGFRDRGPSDSNRVRNRSAEPAR